jgi:hypothetical protein
MTSGKCPSREAIIRFFEERTSQRERWKFLSHVLSCPTCLPVFEAAEEIKSQSQEILRGLEGVELTSREARDRLRKLSRQEILLLRRGRRGKRGSALRWLSISAAGVSLALLVIFAVVPMIRTQKAPPIERTFSALEINLLQPKGTIPASALTFAWTPLPEVQSYRLEIYDQSLEPVYSSGPLSSNQAFLPQDAISRIQRDRLYFWKIVAVLKADRSIIQSEFGKFRLQK